MARQTSPASERSDAGDRRPIRSFLRWAGPILIGWVLSCLPGGFAIDNFSIFAAGIPSAFILYLAIYLMRLHIFLNPGGWVRKLVPAALLIVCFLPIWFLLSGVFTFSLWLPVFLVGTLLRTSSDPGVVSGIIGIILFFGTPTIVFTLMMVLFEKITIGPTAGRFHFYSFLIGGAATGLAMWAFSTSFGLLVFLLLLPLPHLFLVWRGWLVRRPDLRSRFSIRRALVATAVIAVVVYAVGIWRHLPDYGATALAWPSVMRDIETRPEVEQARANVMARPGGRGALPIGDRAYLIPGTFDDDGVSNWSSWDETTRAYRSFDLSVPYEHWIDGFDAAAFDRWRDTRHLERASVSIQPYTTSGALQEPVMCAPPLSFGLRRCYEQQLLEWQAEAWTLDVDTLVPVYLPDSMDRPINLRGVIVLPDGPLSDATALEAPWDVGSQPFIAGCEHWWRGEIDPDAVSPPPDRSNDCRVIFRFGEGRVLLLIDAQVLPFWREIRAGLAADLVDWAAAAEGADRIDIVAERLAEALREELLAQSPDVPPWCQIDRWLSIAFGLDWEDRFATPLCRLPEMLAVGPFPMARYLR